MRFSRRCLQVVVFLCGFVPILTGLWGVIAGPAMIQFNNFEQALDSHFRYLSGLLVAIGLGFWSTIPHIELKTERFRLLALVVIIGGLGRMVSVWVLGFPAKGMLFGLGMELIVTPFLVLWQSRIRV